MSTLIVTMSVDPNRRDQVRRHLENDVAPWAIAQPGFLSGQWLLSADARRALGVVLFDSAHAAELAAAGPRSNPANPTLAWSIESVEVLERVAAA